MGRKKGVPDRRAQVVVREGRERENAGWAGPSAEEKRARKRKKMGQEREFWHEKDFSDFQLLFDLQKHKKTRKAFRKY